MANQVDYDKFAAIMASMISKAVREALLPREEEKEEDVVGRGKSVADSASVLGGSTCARVPGDKDSVSSDADESVKHAAVVSSDMGLSGTACGSGTLGGGELEKVGAQVEEVCGESVASGVGPVESVVSEFASLDVNKPATAQVRAGPGESWVDVVMGGDADVVTSSGQSDSSTEPGASFMAKYVRIPQVEALRNELTTYSKRKIPKSASQDLALSRYTAGTVPDAFSGGRARLKALAMVGDAALLQVTLSRGYRLYGDARLTRMQTSRDRLTDSTMSSVLVRTRLVGHLVVAAGVDLANSKTGATALEAFAGVLALHCGNDAVLAFAVNTRLVV